MEEDSKTLEEVVVVGYGSQKKVSVTGAVAAIQTKELKQSSAANLSTALAGRMPGLTAMQTSGRPGGDDVTLYLIYNLDHILNPFQTPFETVPLAPYRQHS